MNARAHKLSFAALALVLFALGLPGLSRAQNTVNTIAGGGPNNLPALKSSLGDPVSVAFDGAGNYYILDERSDRVFKVDGNNNLTVVAGNGEGAYSGDGGPATAASLNSPASIAVDAAGDIYIADSGNCVVRKVDTSGTITTIAGIGPAAYSSSCGYSGDNGPATSAEIESAQGVSVDAAGDVFIADTFNCSIREVNTSGVISTVAGNGTCGYSGDGGPATSAELYDPYDVVVDSSGNLFIADSASCVIRKVNTSGTISTIAGNQNCSYAGDGGAATSAELNFPQSLFLDPAGNLYIADTENNAIRMISASSGVISTVAGEPGQVTGYSGDGDPATSAQLSAPSGVSVDPVGNIYIADLYNHVIRKVSAVDATISTLAGVSIPDPSTPGQLLGLPSLSGDGYLATQADLTLPAGIASDSQGNLYIADEFNAVVREISSSTGVITTIAGDGVSGSATGDGGPATQARLGSPEDVAVDSLGNLYIADYANCDIRKVSAADGTISTVVGTGNCGLAGDGGPATAAELNGPFGVALDAAGNLYIADSNNNAIRMVSAGTGIISTVAGVSGQSGSSGDGGSATQALLSSPTDVKVDRSGNIFIADYINCAIREVTAGTINTVAGTLGQCGFSGDQGPATSAQIPYPQRVFVDYAGNLFIPTDNVIREVSASTGDIATVAGQYDVYTFGGDGGPALDATFPYPYSLGEDQYGDLLVGDDFFGRVRAISGLAVTPPEANLSTSSLSFQTEALGSAGAALPVSITNPGNTATSISTVAISGTNQSDFSETDNCAGQSLASGASCTLNVTFTPSVAGAETATMTVTDAVGTQTVSLSGAGIDFSGAAAPNGSTSATVTQGQTANYSLQLSATGGASPSDQISVTVTCSGAPQEATCSVPTLPVVVSPGTPGNFTVSVSTTAPTASAVPPSAIRDFPGPRPMLLAAAGLSLALSLLALLATVLQRRRKLWLAFAVPVLLSVIAAGCSNGGKKLTGGTPTGQYTITVTTASGSDTHTMQLSLEVNSAQ